MDWNLTPLRAPGLDISEATDGLVIYQYDRDRLHYLNQTAAFVLECCDGTVCAGELPAIVAAAFGLAQPPQTEVEQCLAALLQEGLLIVDSVDSGGGKFATT